MYPKKIMHYYNTKIQKKKNTTKKLKVTSAGIEPATPATHPLNHGSLENECRNTGQERQLSYSARCQSGSFRSVTKSAKGERREADRNLG